MAAISEITLYERLRASLGEERAKDIVEFIDARVDDKVKAKQDALATKADIAEVKADLIRYVTTLYMAGFLAMMAAIVGLYFKH